MTDEFTVEALKSAMDALKRAGPPIQPQKCKKCGKGYYFMFVNPDISQEDLERILDLLPDSECDHEF